MSSRRRSIIKFLPEARNSSAFSVEIYIKDFTREIICESLKYFLRSNILKKISSKDLPMVCFVVTQHSESALSLCLRYSKTSCLQATPKNTVSQNCYLLSVICNAKNSFWETVNCNGWCELAWSKKQKPVLVF